MYSTWVSSVRSVSSCFTASSCFLPFVSVSRSMMSELGQSTTERERKDDLAGEVVSAVPEFSLAESKPPPFTTDFSNTHCDVFNPGCADRLATDRYRLIIVLNTIKLQFARCVPRKSLVEERNQNISTPQTSSDIWSFMLASCENSSHSLTWWRQTESGTV